MRKLVFGLEALLLLSLTGCTPGIFFRLRNDTGAMIDVIYSVKPEWLHENGTPRHAAVLPPDGLETLSFSWQKMLNAGYTAKKDHIDIETFTAIFDDLAVSTPDGKTISSLSDFTQEDIGYEYPFVSSVAFVLSIKPPAEAR
jgi:hypothetical protein